MHYGRLTYNISLFLQYLGSTEVDQPKGIEVVKDAICKLKFNQQIKKSEGTKTPKVELTISIDGVAIQEPKTKTSPKVRIYMYTAATFFAVYIVERVHFVLT